MQIIGSEEVTMRQRWRRIEVNEVPVWEVTESRKRGPPHATKHPSRLCFDALRVNALVVLLLAISMLLAIKHAKGQNSLLIDTHTNIHAHTHTHTRTRIYQRN